MTPIEIAVFKAKSKGEAIAQLELLERTELKAIADGLGLHVNGSRNTLITSIIVRTHPASKRPCGCPEPVVVVQEGF